MAENPDGFDIVEFRRLTNNAARSAEQFSYIARDPRRDPHEIVHRVFQLQGTIGLLMLYLYEKSGR